VPAAPHGVKARVAGVKGAEPVTTQSGHQDVGQGQHPPDSRDLNTLGGPKCRLCTSSVVEIPLWDRYDVHMTDLTDIEVVLGSGIRARRKQLGLTQQDVADLSGLSRDTVVRVEAGDTRARIETLTRIAAAVGLTLTLAPQYREV